MESQAIQEARTAPRIVHARGKTTGRKPPDETKAAKTRRRSGSRSRYHTIPSRRGGSYSKRARPVSRPEQASPQRHPCQRQKEEPSRARPQRSKTPPDRWPSPSVARKILQMILFPKNIPPAPWKGKPSSNPDTGTISLVVDTTPAPIPATPRKREISSQPK